MSTLSWVITDPKVQTQDFGVRSKIHLLSAVHLFDSFLFQRLIYSLATKKIQVERQEQVNKF